MVDVMLEYQGTDISAKQYRGVVTGRKYRFSGHPNSRVKPVDVQDSEKFLSLRIGKGPMFAVYGQNERKAMLAPTSEMAALIDPEGYTIGQLTNVIAGYTADELYGIRAAEVAGKDRTGALDAIDRLLTMRSNG